MSMAPAINRTSERTTKNFLNKINKKNILKYEDEWKLGIKNKKLGIAKSFTGRLRKMDPKEL